MKIDKRATTIGKFSSQWKMEHSIRILAILSIILLINYSPKTCVASTINANPNLFSAAYLVYFKIHKLLSRFINIILNVCLYQ